MAAQNISRTIFAISCIVSIFFAPLGAPIAPSSGSTAILHAQPRNMATNMPEGTIRVIVRINGAPAEFQTVVADLGGRIVSNLQFIRSMVVEIPAANLSALGSQPVVVAISPDAPVVENKCKKCWKGMAPNSFYAEIIGAKQLWTDTTPLKGEGVKVAIVDSGFSDHIDLHQTWKKNSPLRISGVNFTDAQKAVDRYGHGTHVAGVIGGNGAASRGLYMGVAPKVEMVGVKVCGNKGECLTSDVLEGLQWIYDNGHAEGIRIVNLSINSSVHESYHTNPLCAALEVLWFNGFVVVVAAGNERDGQLYPPANDPFVITVGSTDDQGTVEVTDDSVSDFSAYGLTEQGIVKPDLVAPGRDLVSLLNSKKSIIAKEHPDHIVEGRMRAIDDYFRISGTSVSAAVVSGAAALLLQAHPDLNPDQVKYRLMATATKTGGWPAYNPETTGAGYINAYAAVHSDSLDTANTGVVISQMLWTEEDWVNYGSVNWGTVNWGTVNWGSVNWGTVNWGTVNWGTVNWGSVNWGSDYWEEESSEGS